jgi:hypothetical protein
MRTAIYTQVTATGKTAMGGGSEEDEVEDNDQ